MPQKIMQDNSKIAMVLVQALFYGDKAAAKEWGLTVQTVRNYRKRLDTDSDLVSDFIVTRNRFTEGWLDEAPIAIRKSVRWIMDTIPKLEPTAENLETVGNALKILTEVKLTKEAFDVRLREYNQHYTEQNRQVAATEARAVITDQAS